MHANFVSLLNLVSPSSLTKISAIALILVTFLPSLGGENGKRNPFHLSTKIRIFVEKSALATFIVVMVILYFTFFSILSTSVLFK